MQKALNQMNPQFHHVLSDVTGVTGLAILDAILGGERDPQVLACHRDGRIKASRETIAKALVGDYHTGITSACDGEVQRLLGAVASQVDLARQSLPPAPAGRRKPHRKIPSFDLWADLYRVLGTDLTQMPGLQTPAIHTLFAELGADLSAFPSGAHFASWLGLCPDNRISGGKVLSVTTRPVKRRVAQACGLPPRVCAACGRSSAPRRRPLPPRTSSRASSIT